MHFQANQTVVPDIGTHPQDRADFEKVYRLRGRGWRHRGAEIAELFADLPDAGAWSAVPLAAVRSYHQVTEP